MTLGPEPPPPGVGREPNHVKEWVNGICHCTKLSQGEIRLHNPGIEGTGSGIKGHPKASHENPGHHGSLGSQGDLMAVSNTEIDAQREEH